MAILAFVEATHAKIDYDGVKKLVFVFLLNNVVVCKVITCKSTFRNVG